MSRPRWDTDDSGEGVTDGRRFLPALDAFRGAMAAPGWVAEAPEAHLLPHLERAIGASQGRWRLIGTRTDDGLLELDLAWSGHEPGRDAARLRAHAIALIGEIAEQATFVHQRTLARETVFDVTTGLADDDAPFAPHGHLLRLRVRLPSGHSLRSPEVLA